MAFQLRWTGAHSNLGHIYYNIDHPVGESVGCDPEDVMLVQALLRLVFYEFKYCPPPAGRTFLKIDGKCGPSTQAHLRAFKAQIRREGVPTIADGQIDPIDGNPNTAATGRTKHRFVLEVLNHMTLEMAQRAGRPEARDFHTKPPENDVPVPDTLYKALQRTHTWLNP